ncbi:nucleotide sugar dehydrogenase [Candidatus Woesearchaeota archaeon]|nr:nucleotide sugar dehydrogenase [Candidatus Woesearchaeota archaeon]
MKVSIIGMGYVGFPLACAIAKKTEHEVIGIDLSKQKVDLINQKKSPVEDKQAEKDIKEISLSASTDFSKIDSSDLIIIAVPTPIKENKLPDLSCIESATDSILPFLKKGQLIILESTVNPGVCDEVLIPALERSGLRCNEDFNVAHCPERIDPGNKKYNVYNIPRNIGASSSESAAFAKKFYSSFIDADINVVSSLKAAEASKVIENTFRDINIAYVNELAKSFDLMGLDIIEIINAASNKPFAFMPHFPGCGVGGHCIPVDPYYLIQKARDMGFEHSFLQMARDVNNSMPEYTVQKLENSLAEIGKKIKGTKVCLLGLSYKPNVGDLRESPALEIKKILNDRGADLAVVDPHIEGTQELSKSLERSEAVILATAHDDFKKISDWKGVKIVIDGRNCLDKSYFISKGIIYRGIGR